MEGGRREDAELQSGPLTTVNPKKRGNHGDQKVLQFQSRGTLAATSGVWPRLALRAARPESWLASRSSTCSVEAPSMEL